MPCCARPSTRAAYGLRRAGLRGRRLPTTNTSPPVTAPAVATVTGGTLSEAALASFAQFFLRICINQVEFM